MDYSAEPPLKRAKTDIDLATEKETGGDPILAAKGLSETDVGITQYLGDHLGFRGVLKQRYTDFLVNEISETGEVLQINHIPVQTPKKQKQQSQPKEQKAESVKEDLPIDPEAEAKLRALVGEGLATKLQEVLQHGGSCQSDAAIDDKDERGEIHRLVRAAYYGKIDSKTTSTNILQFNKTTRGGGRRGRDNNNDSAKQNIDPVVIQKAGRRDEFTHFTIYKENKESLEVCRLIAKFLRKKPKSVSIAGTKDRRGVTVQRASIHQTPVDRLISLNRAFREIILTDFKYEHQRIKLGDLKGNEFVITVRDAELVKDSNRYESMEDAVSESLMSLKRTGFINYFGMQRFGTYDVSTHTVGLQLLKANYREAAHLLLSPQPFALAESTAAREQYAQDPDDISAALKLMPRSCDAEYCILSALEKAPRDWLGAIMRISRNLRTMYVHAYQSYVWNSVVSERIAKFGLKVLEGDLVIDNNKDAQFSEAVNEDDFEEDLLDVAGPRFIQARPITAQELGDFTIFDIVMPTPGFAILYPSNPDLCQLYESVMSKDGMDPYNMRHNVKEFSLSGAYRNILAKPEAVEWQCFRHSDLLQQFVRTDVDVIRAGLDGTSAARILSQDEVPAGDYFSVVMTMRLGTSQYATMAIREAMKVETSRRGDLQDVRIIGTRSGDLLSQPS